MAIPIAKEEDEAPSVLERCCFCRTPTPFWTRLKDRKPGEQVACCPSCAQDWRRKDVPTKHYWCYREHLATPRSFVNHEPVRGPLAK